MSSWQYLMIQILFICLAHIALCRKIAVAPTSQCTQRTAVTQSIGCHCNLLCFDKTTIGQQGQCQNHGSCAGFNPVPNCARNQHFTIDVPYTYPDAGKGVCAQQAYPAKNCVWEKIQWNYKCCNCPPGYIDMREGKCQDGDTSGSCVGCSDPQEQLTWVAKDNTWACIQPPLCPRCIPSKDSCGFYDCLESQYSCKGTLYPYTIDSGSKFCNRFSEFFNEFDAKGQQWVRDVRLCLQNALLPEANCKSNCKRVQEVGFASHTNCYVEYGVCGLGPANLLVLQKVVGAEVFRSLAAFLQGLSTASICVGLISVAFRV